MAEVKDFIEMGNGYARQIAALNPVISTKPIRQWLDEAADKAEHDQFIQEATLEYNLSLLEGESPISEAEMAEIMEEKMGKQSKTCLKCKYCLNPPGCKMNGKIICMLFLDEKWAEIALEDPDIGQDCRYFNAGAKGKERPQWSEKPKIMVRKKALEQAFIERELLTFADDEDDKDGDKFEKIKFDGVSISELKAEIELLKDALRKLRKENEELKGYLADTVNDRMREYYLAKRGEL